jgi:hypothetical protein
VVLANCHDTLDVLTLDERHFRALKGRAGVCFVLCRPTPVDLRERL